MRETIAINLGTLPYEKVREKTHAHEHIHRNIVRNAFLRVARINFIEIVDYSRKNNNNNSNNVVEKETEALIRNRLCHGNSIQIPSHKQPQHTFDINVNHKMPLHCNIDTRI